MIAGIMLTDRQLIKANLVSKRFLRFLPSSQDSDHCCRDVVYKLVLLLGVMIPYFIVNGALFGNVQTKQLSLVIVTGNLHMALRILVTLESMVRIGKESHFVVQHFLSILHNLVLQLSMLVFIAYFVMQTYLWEIGTAGNFTTLEEILLYILIPGFSSVPIFCEILLFRHWYFLVSTVPFCLGYLILLIEQDGRSLSQSEGGKLTFSSSWVALWIFMSLLLMMSTQYLAWWTNRWILLKFYKTRWWKLQPGESATRASEQELATFSSNVETPTRYKGYLPRIYFS